MGFGTSATGIEIETVPVGNVNNSGDVVVASDGTTGHGVVSYNYRISTYEVTNTQYVEFLNAVGATDTHALYQPENGQQSSRRHHPKRYQRKLYVLGSTEHGGQTSQLDRTARRRTIRQLAP